MTLASTTALSSEQQATLNNIRAILKRQLRPLSGTDVNAIAMLLAQHAELMRGAGLGKELMDYLQEAMNALDEDSPAFNSLQLELAKTMDALGGYEYEAGALYSELLDTFMRQDIATTGRDRARTQVAYAAHLRGRGNTEDALNFLQQAAQQFQNMNLVAESAAAWSELGKVYAARGELDSAIKHFEYALQLLPQDTHIALQAEIIVEEVNTLLQKGHIARVEALLEIARSTAMQHALPLIQAKIERQLAYLAQMRARSQDDPQASQGYYDQAEAHLYRAIEILLSLHHTGELAISYHDLGRLEAQRKQYDAAEAHIRKSAELFSRIDDRRSFAVAQITLGQLILVKERDAEAAIERIRQAFSIATTLQDQHTQSQAAKSLARIHNMQSQRALKHDRNTQAQVRQHIQYSLERLQQAQGADLSDAIESLENSLSQLPIGQ